MRRFQVAETVELPLQGQQTARVVTAADTAATDAGAALAAAPEGGRRVAPRLEQPSSAVALSCDCPAKRTHPGASSACAAWARSQRCVALVVAACTPLCGGLAGARPLAVLRLVLLLVPAPARADVGCCRSAAMSVDPGVPAATMPR